MSFDARKNRDQGGQGLSTAPRRPASAWSPGKQARTQGGAPGWGAMLGNLGVPPASGPAATARGPGAIPARGGAAPDSRTGPGQIQRQESGAAPATLDPGAALAALNRIALDAEQIRDAVNPDGTAGAGLDPGAGAEYTRRLRGFTRQTEDLQPAIRACGDAGMRGLLDQQLAHTQDTIVSAYQMLAVYYADQTLQTWSNTTDADTKAAQRTQYHVEAGTGGGADQMKLDWCGMFVDAQYRAAGMSGALNMVFNSTSDALQFFTYGAGSSKVPGWIQPLGQGEVRAVLDYHTERGSTRTWLAHGMFDDRNPDLRPGDVVTLDWLGPNDKNDKQANPEDRADHVCIVRSYDAATGVLVTIDGNAYGARKPGPDSPTFDPKKKENVPVGSDATTSDVTTSQYQTGPGGKAGYKGAQNDGPAFNREQMTPATDDVYKAMTIMGRGRPSVVDFERDHVYFLQPPALGGTPVTGDADGPDGPIQDQGWRPRPPGGQQILRRETGGATPVDPEQAFAAAARGAAGEVPHRAEMEARLGADFGAVHAFVGRDLGALGAHAATRGETVVFASASPDRETVAHELTHVIQSRQGHTGSAVMSDPGDASEHEARSVASAVVAERPVTVGAAPSAAIHRQRGDGSPPPAVSPPMAGNYAGGGLDWDIYNYISMAALPNGQQPNTVREIFDYYLLHHLQEQLPELYAKYPSVPPESERGQQGVKDRAAAVAGLGQIIVDHVRELRVAGQGVEAEQIRVKLFTANQHAVIDALRVASSSRYLPQGDTTFCNVYAYDVVTAMGGYLPRVWWTDRGLKALAAGATLISVEDYNAKAKTGDPGNVVTNDSPFTQQVDANGLDDWMVLWGATYGWQRLDSPEIAQQTADEGVLVVITATTGSDQKPGHISVVLAETEQRKHPAVADTGGDYVPLQSQAGAQNFTSNAAGVQGIGQTGRSQWWRDPKFIHAGFWAYRGVARDTAVQRPDLMGAKLPDP